MGQGGVNSKEGGVKNKPSQGPTHLLHLQPLVQTKRAFPVQMSNSCIRALKQKLTTQEL